MNWKSICEDLFKEWKRVKESKKNLAKEISNMKDTIIMLEFAYINLIYRKRKQLVFYLVSS